MFGPSQKAIAPSPSYRPANVSDSSCSNNNNKEFFALHRLVIITVAKRIKYYHLFPTSFSELIMLFGVSRPKELSDVKPISVAGKSQAVLPNAHV